MMQGVGSKHCFRSWREGAEDKKNSRGSNSGHWCGLRGSWGASGIDFLGLGAQAWSGCGLQGGERHLWRLTFPFLSKSSWLKAVCHIPYGGSEI